MLALTKELEGTEDWLGSRKLSRMQQWQFRRCSTAGADIEYPGKNSGVCWLQRGPSRSFTGRLFSPWGLAVELSGWPCSGPSFWPLVLTVATPAGAPCRRGEGTLTARARHGVGPRPRGASLPPSVPQHPHLAKLNVVPFGKEKKYLKGVDLFLTRNEG